MYFHRKNQKVLSYMVSLSILFPKGIGTPILGNVLDVNKILILSSFLIVLKINRSLIISKYTFSIFLFILAILLQSYTWHNFSQYIFLLFYILFYFSAYFVGKSILFDKNAMLYFGNIFSRVYIITTAFSLSDYYFKFLPLKELRPFGEEFELLKSRGEILGQKIDYYMGFDFNLHYFVYDRAFLFSLIFIILIMLKDHINDRKLYNLFLVTISFVMLEILLSQARFTTFFCGLLYVYVLIKSWRNKITISILSIISIMSIIFINKIFYYLSGVISLFTLIGIKNINFNYVLLTDKRYVAISNFLTEIKNGQFNIFSSEGPLFFNFTKTVHAAPADYWDDVSVIFTSTVEFGFIPVLIILLSSLSLFFKKNTSGKCLVLFICMITFFTVPAFTPKFYYYYFLIIGGIVASRKLYMRNKII